MRSVNDSCAATAQGELSTVCAGTAATNIVGGSGGPSGINAAPFGITQNLLAKWVSQRIAAVDNHATSRRFPICDDGRSPEFLFALPADACAWE